MLTFTAARRVGWIVCVAAFLTGCGKTGKLTPTLTSRFEQEGIVHRADDIVFRKTLVSASSNGSWEDKKASIVVTKQSVFLHVNGKPLVEITPRSTGYYDVHRDHDRVALRAGTGKQAASWSFRPPDDADGWTEDIRAVIKNQPTPSTSASTQPTTGAATAHARSSKSSKGKKHK